MMNKVLGRMSPEQIASLKDKIPDMRLKVGEELFKSTNPKLIGEDGNPIKYEGPVDPGFDMDRGGFSPPRLPVRPPVGIYPPRPLPPGFNRGGPPIEIGGPVLPPRLPNPIGIYPPRLPIPPLPNPFPQPNPRQPIAPPVEMPTPIQPMPQPAPIAPPRFSGIRSIIGRRR